MGTLNAFVERPALRAAFDQHALGWPVCANRWTAVALPPVPTLAWATTAFHYLVRFELSRWSVQHRIPATSTSWVARLGLHNLTCFPHLAAQTPRWTRFLDAAEARVGSFLQGEPVSVDERVRMALLLAQLDPLYRRPHAAAVHMRPPMAPPIALLDQLKTWNDAFCDDWARLPTPTHRILINPEYAWVPAVGGADADLVIDDTLVGLVTASRGDARRLAERLAGHAAMSWLAGFHLPSQAHLGAPVQAIGVYQVRAPAARWHQVALAELFPGDHWEAYLRAFAEQARQG